MNFKALSICQEIERQKIPGVIEACPGNISYLVHRRPDEIHPEKLVKVLCELEHKTEQVGAISSRLVLAAQHDRS